MQTDFWRLGVTHFFSVFSTAEAVSKCLYREKVPPEKFSEIEWLVFFKYATFRLTDVARTGKVRMWWLQICFVVQPYLG